MTKQKFSKLEALQFGWKTVKGKFGFLAFLIIVAGTLMFIPNLIAHQTVRTYPVFGFVLHFFAWFFSSVVILGLLKIFLDICDQKKATIRNLFSQYSLVFSYLLGSVMFLFIIFSGAIFFLIPGIILATRLSFFPYFIVEKKKGPADAIKESFLLTAGSSWNLFFLFLTFIVINMFGIFCLFVGFLFTAPLTMSATVFVYRKLLDAQKVTDQDSLEGV